MPEISRSQYTNPARFSTFFEKAFVSRVKRRMLIRIVRFARSTCDVLMCWPSGEPVMTSAWEPMQTAGEYFAAPPLRSVAMSDP